MTEKTSYAVRNRPPTPLAARADPPINSKPVVLPSSVTASEREAQGATMPSYAERRKFLPLSDALNWVAKASPAANAADDLRLALQDGEIAGRGTPALSFGDVQPISPGKWVEGTVDWEKGTLRSVPHGYTNITIARADLERVWPDTRAAKSNGAPESSAAPPAAGETPPAPDPYRTGAPGKPTIKHLILAEFRRRVRTGDAFPVLADEAEALSDWAAHEHPAAPTPTARTVENQIRDQFRRSVRTSPTK